jgi:hypothetical protein
MACSTHPRLYHDGDSPLAFLVLHRGEWVHPDDVDADRD